MVPSVLLPDTNKIFPFALLMAELDPLDSSVAMVLPVMEISPESAESCNVLFAIVTLLVALTSMLFPFSFSLVAVTVAPLTATSLEETVTEGALITPSSVICLPPFSSKSLLTVTLPPTVRVPSVSSTLVVNVSVVMVPIVDTS